MTSPTDAVAGDVPVAVAAFTDSVADCFADESTEDRSTESFSVRVAEGPRDVRSDDVLRVERVSDESRVGFVVDRPEPNVVRGLVPDAVDPAVESESVLAVAEASAEPVGEFTEPDDEPADPDDEPGESDDELEDDCPPSSANAVPIPAVPTSPATPSEKATAPTRSAATRNAPLGAFIGGPTPPQDRASDDSSAAQPDVPEAVAALTAIPVSEIGVALRDLDIRTVDLAGIQRRVTALHLDLVGVRHANAEGEQPSQRQRSRGDHSLHARASPRCSPITALCAGAKVLTQPLSARKANVN
nr:hypothetical protein [Mycolicibacterium komanii]